MSTNENVWVRREDTEEIITLNHFPFVIGSAEDADYRVEGLSPRQVEFHRISNFAPAYTITDCSESQTTYLNRCRLLHTQPRILRSEDEIRLGDITFKYHQPQTISRW